MSLTLEESKMLHDLHAAVVGNEAIGHEGLVKRVKTLENSEKKRVVRGNVLILLGGAIAEGFKWILGLNSHQ